MFTPQINEFTAGEVTEKPAIVCFWHYAEKKGIDYQVFLRDEKGIYPVAQAQLVTHLYCWLTFLLMKKYVYVYLVIGILLFSNGCVSHKAVQDFAATSATATNRLPALATDLSESCTRQKQYLAIRGGDFDPLRLRQDADNQCLDFKTSEKSFITANKVLVEYLQTLGKLAGGETITYDKNLDKLAGNLGETKLLPKEKVSTVNAVVKFLANASSDKWRKKQVGKAIVQVNPDIQRLLLTLSTLITRDYFQLLEDEELAAKNLYLGTIKANKKKEPVTIILLQQQWDRDYKTLQRRKKTATTYGEILTTIAQGHQLMADKQSTITKKAVQKEIMDYTAKITPLIADINDTF